MWNTITAHLTPLETVFSAIAMVALSVSVYAWRDAHIDSAILSAAGVNGPRRAIADNNIHQELLRFGIALVMVVTSWSFLYLAPPPPDYSGLPQSIAGLVAWILISLMVMTSSLMDKGIRKKLQQYAPMEVQTQSRTVPAPITADGGRSETPTADVIKAALDAREDQRLEDAANGKADAGHKGPATGSIPVVVTPDVKTAKTLVQALAVQTEIQTLAAQTETLAEETCASAAETTKAIEKQAEPTAPPPKDAT